MSKKKSRRILQEYTPKVSSFNGALKYKNLREVITKEKILERSYLYYGILISTVFALYFLSIYYIITLNSAWALIFWCVLFSALAVQIAGLVHDSGHRAIFKSVRANDLFGKFASSFIAMRYESWRVKHNEHHAHPNQEDEDPDFALPFLAFTEDEFKRKKGIGRLLRKYQVYMYFPIGLFVVFTTRFRSIREFITDFKWKELWELAIFSAVFVTWFILPFVFFPLAKALLVFGVVNGVTGFYLFNIFAPNHKGMPKLAKGVKISFLEQQIMTSRDIESNIFTDFIYLGLNNQIEHHLFPNCPRNKLHLLIPHVRSAAKEAGLDYTSVGIIHTNKMILNELKEVALTA